MQYQEFIDKLIEVLNEMTSALCVCKKTDGGIKLVVANDMSIFIADRVYDKFYTPFMEYESRDEVRYRDGDIGIAINNIKYAVMSEFEKLIFLSK